MMLMPRIQFRDRPQRRIFSCVAAVHRAAVHRAAVHRNARHSPVALTGFVFAVAAALIANVGSPAAAQALGNSPADSPSNARTLAVAQEWPDPSASEREIARLIEMLGSAQFELREKAKEELAQFGVVAFEQLHAARQHPDVEIRKQAEFLLQDIQVSWVQQDDPETVKRSLRKYEDGTAEGRLRELIKLGRNSEPASVEALCRLVRFETSEAFSKLAALEILERRAHNTELTSGQLQQAIAKVLGRSERRGAHWVRAYATLDNDVDQGCQTWASLFQKECESTTNSPDKAGIAILHRLMRWYVEQLQQIGGRETEMLTALEQVLPLHGNRDAELADTAQWLVDTRAWSLFERFVTEYKPQFEQSPQLRFCQAEMLWEKGEREAAEAIVKKIKEEPNIDAFVHVALGIDLHLYRGRIDWAEGQFRHVIETEEVGSHGWIEAHNRLGLMFHDQINNEAAYNAFRPLVEAMTSDKIVMRRIQELGRVPLTIRAQMHFSHALLLAEQGQHDKERSELEAAFRFDSDNADILIAMYRLEGADAGWQKDTQDKIDRLAKKYENQVAYYKRTRSVRSGAVSELAKAYNQFAWLIGNTEGDYEQALRYSLESLELLPDEAGYLDTLARCYYALGNLDDALRTQRRAVELEPHSGQIANQLAFFESERRKQNAEE